VILHDNHVILHSMCSLNVLLDRVNVYTKLLCGFQFCKIPLMEVKHHYPLSNNNCSASLNLANLHGQQFP